MNCLDGTNDEAAELVNATVRDCWASAASAADAARP